MFFGLVTKHARDGQTDGWTDKITTPKTALSIARAVKRCLYCWKKLEFARIETLLKQNVVEHDTFTNALHHLC